MKKKIINGNNNDIINIHTKFKNSRFYYCDFSTKNIYYAEPILRKIKVRMFTIDDNNENAIIVGVNFKLIIPIQQLQHNNNTYIIPTITKQYIISTNKQDIERFIKKHYLKNSTIQEVISTNPKFIPNHYLNNTTPTTAYKALKYKILLAQLKKL